MYSPFKMKGKSPMIKALIGKQNNLPAELKAKIEAAPESPAKMMKKSPAKKNPTLPVNKSDNTSVNNNDAMIAQDSIDRKAKQDKLNRALSRGRPTSAGSMMGRDPNNKFVKSFFDEDSPSKMKKKSPAKMKKESSMKMKKAPVKSAGKKPAVKSGEMAWIKGDRWETGTVAEMHASLGTKGPKGNKAKTIKDRKAQEKATPAKMKKKSSMKMMKKK